MKKKICLILALMVLLSLTGCKGKPKVLLDTDLLKVEQEGAKIHVYDVESNMTYTFYIRHKKPSNRVLEPYTVTDTPTLRIEKQYKKIILYVKRSEEIYTISISRIFPNISLKLGGE